MEEEGNHNVRKITIIEKSHKYEIENQIKKKEKVKRLITETWNLPEEGYIHGNQIKWLDEMQLPRNEEIHSMIRREIAKKLHSYKYQDVEKGIFLQNQFVTLDYTLSLLRSSKLQCYYCDKKVYLFYSYVREPMQWTFDRIDNVYGHNIENVVVSCLSCNLRRRCANMDKFQFTKRMVLSKTETVAEPVTVPTTSVTAGTHLQGDEHDAPCVTDSILKSLTSRTFVIHKKKNNSEK